mgnify:CR=1 FL=1
MDKKTANVLVVSDALSTGYTYAENLALHNDFQGLNSVNNLFIECRQYDASYFFDYMRVEAGKDLTIELPQIERVRPTPIDPPVSKTPVMRAVPWRNNVMYQGEYFYFATPLAWSGEDLMANVVEAFRVFGMRTESDGVVYNGMRNDMTVSIKLGSDIATVNEQELKMSKSVAVQNGKPVISLQVLAAVIGLNTEWNVDEKTLYITSHENAEGEVAE